MIFGVNIASICQKESSAAVLPDGQFAPVNIFFSLGSLRHYETLEGCLDAALHDAGFEGPYRASPPP